MDIDSNGSMKKAEKYCLRLLAVKARSEYEIKKRLRDKGYSQECSILLIQKLKEKRFIDDKALAEDWIVSRIKFKPRSKKLLQQELIAKGISVDIIEKALDDASEILNDRELSVQILTEQLSKVEGLSSEKKKIKLFRLLLARGFDPDMAQEAIESYLSLTER